LRQFCNSYMTALYFYKKFPPNPNFKKLDQALESLVPSRLAK